MCWEFFNCTVELTKWYSISYPRDDWFAALHEPVFWGHFHSSVIIEHITLQPQAKVIRACSRFCKTS